MKLQQKNLERCEKDWFKTKRDSQPDFASQDAGPSPVSAIVRNDSSHANAAEPKINIGAPCGPKPALDPLALKSLQNTPRKSERNEILDSSGGNTTNKTVTKTPENHFDFSSKISNNSADPVAKAATSSTANVTKANPGSSIVSSPSVQSRQDSFRSQPLRKAQSSEEEAFDTEISSEGNDFSRSDTQSCEVFERLILQWLQLRKDAGKLRWVGKTTFWFYHEYHQRLFWAI